MSPRWRSVSSTASTIGTTRSAAERERSSSPASTSTQKPSTARTGASHTLPVGVGTGPGSRGTLGLQPGSPPPTGLRARPS